MPGKKKITEELRKLIITRLKRKQMPNAIAKDLGLHRLTVAAIGRKAGVWKSPNKKVDHVNRSGSPAAATRSGLDYAGWINYGIDKGWLKVRIDRDRRVQVELA